MDIVPRQPAVPPAKSPFKWRIIGGALAAIGLIGIGLMLIHMKSGTNPVPVDIRKAVDFAVYYPQQQKLPKGYSLDMTSFRLAQPGVVVYSVKSASQQLVFSEEQLPEGAIIDKFTASYIPLHNVITTQFGKAVVGSAGQGKQLQTIVSLPITKGPWLVITAPADMPQSELRQILQSLAR